MMFNFTHMIELNWMSSSAKATEAAILHVPPGLILKEQKMNAATQHFKPPPHHQIHPCNFIGFTLSYIFWLEML